jgi:predicted Na+-dependent transporter
MALLLTVATNFAAVFTLPFTITRLLGPSLGPSMSPWPLLAQLTTSVLLPTIIGATARACIPGAPLLTPLHPFLPECCGLLPGLACGKVLFSSSFMSIAGEGVG